MKENENINNECHLLFSQRTIDIAYKAFLAEYRTWQCLKAVAINVALRFPKITSYAQVSSSSWNSSSGLDTEEKTK